VDVTIQNNIIGTAGVAGSVPSRRGVTHLKERVVTEGGDA